ncbi:hypothetical protein HDU67_003448, partial [Dinochytrium kinnereticum]
MRDPAVSVNRASSMRASGDLSSSGGKDRRQEGTAVFKTMSDSGSQLALNVGSTGSLCKKEKSDSAFLNHAYPDAMKQSSWSDLKTLEDSLMKIAATKPMVESEQRIGRMDGILKGNVAILPNDAKGAMEYVDDRRPTEVNAGRSRSASKSEKVTGSEFGGVPSMSAEELARVLGSHTSLNFLLIDMRGKDEFTSSQIRSSVNVSLPAIILKRFRKGSVSTFNLLHFLTTQQSKLVYHEWKARAAQERSLIVVYDVDTTTGDVDSDVFTFAKTLQCGVFGNIDEENIQIAKERVKSNVSVSYLHGGFDAFSLFDTEKKFIWSSSASMEGVERSNPSDELTMAPSRLILEYGSKPAPMVIRPPAMNKISAGELKLSPQSSSPQSSTSMDLSPTNNNKAQRKRSTLSIHTPVSGGSKVDSKIGSVTNAFPELPMAAAQGSQLNAGLAQVNEAFSPEIMESVSTVNDYLLLGSDAIPTADDAVAQLQALGVTHVLNMAAEIHSKALLSEENRVITHKWIKLQDSADQEVEEAIRDGIRYIDEARAGNPNAKVLVHCRAGKSRSVTMVLAYLINREGMTLKDAY